MTRACLHNPGATRRRRGLTLVEILIALLILSIGLLGLAGEADPAVVPGVVLDLVEPGGGDGVAVLPRHHLDLVADRLDVPVDYVPLEASGGASYHRGNELSRLYRDVMAGVFHPSDDESAHNTLANFMLGPLD